MEEKGKSRFRMGVIIMDIMMVTLIVAEIVVCLCMGKVQASETLEADFMAAMGSKEQLDRELSLIKVAKMENAEAPIVIASLMSGRPAEVSFEILEIQGTGEENIIVNLAVRAKNEEALQKYVKNLIGSKKLRSVNLVKSENNEDGSKSAVIVVGKGRKTAYDTIY